jgi:hypothetical protein
MILTVGATLLGALYLIEAYMRESRYRSAILRRLLEI